jgi:hypothetical protein
MKLAMTSIAVTASICASASEAALLVASFMHVSLDSGTSHRCPGRPTTRSIFYSEHPATSIRFDESPLSEYRPLQARTVMRRHFDSGVTRLANGAAKPGQGPCALQVAADFVRRSRLLIPWVAPDTVSGLNPLNDKNNPRPRSQNPKVKHGPHRLLRYFEIE